MFSCSGGVESNPQGIGRQLCAHARAKSARAIFAAAPTGGCRVLLRVSLGFEGLQRQRMYSRRRQ